MQERREAGLGHFVLTCGRLNRCDLITISGGGHGMGGWDKLKSDYKEQLVAWLKTTLK